MLKMNKNELVQFQFAPIINQTKDATLLNYGFVDMGFYTATGITPNIRFFEKVNIYYPLFPINVDEQNRYIKEKEIDYVVLRQEVSPSSVKIEVPYLYNNYKLIMESKQYSSNAEYNYLLFKKIAKEKGLNS